MRPTSPGRRPRARPGSGSRDPDANKSGGFRPKNAEEIDELLQRVADDIRNMYTIGYVPANVSVTSKARKDALRRVAVDVRLPTGQKLAVRTRRAYLAGEETSNDDR